MSDNANHENSRYREDQQNLQLNVLVAVDNVITEHHKNLTDVTHGLKAYITSLIHLVDNIFQHDTLDRRLRIHLLGIHEFTKEESNLIIYENAPNETLNAVCDLLADPKLEPRYSTQDQKGTADHKDISIFLTRRRFGPAGRNTWSNTPFLVQMKHKNLDRKIFAWFKLYDTILLKKIKIINKKS